MIQTLRSVLLRSCARGVLALGALLLLGGCVSNPAPASAALNADAPNSGSADADKRARVRLELAEGYYQRGEPAVALDEVGKALALAPDFVPAYTMQGLILMDLGQDPDAERSFRKALELAPHDGDTLHDYGWLLCNGRRYPESFELFKRALAVPRYAGAERTNLAYGVCQMRSGDLAGAERSLRNGFALNPSSPALATNLALALYRENRSADALFYVQRVNAGPAANAQSLWLGVLVARGAGDPGDADAWSAQLVQRFPDAREAIAAQQGRFDDSLLLGH